MSFFFSFFQMVIVDGEDLASLCSIVLLLVSPFDVLCFLFLFVLLDVLALALLVGCVVALLGVVVSVVVLCVVETS
jgi:hypothetical protein